MVSYVLRMLFQLVDTGPGVWLRRMSDNFNPDGLSPAGDRPGTGASGKLYYVHV
jgi:hypothetical protein